MRPKAAKAACARCGGSGHTDPVSILARRGDGDRRHVAESARSSKAGVFVPAVYVDYDEFKGDIILIHGAKKGGLEGTRAGLTPLMVTKDDLMLRESLAVDGNMELYPVDVAAKATIEAYGFGSTTRDPWFEAPNARSRRY